MNKNVKMIVLGLSCITLVVGTLSIKKIIYNNENNAEVSDKVLSTNIDKSTGENEEILQEDKELTNDNSVNAEEKDSSNGDFDNIEVASNDLQNTTEYEDKQEVGKSESNGNSNGGTNDYIPPTSNDNIPVTPPKPTPPPIEPPQVEEPEIPDVVFPTVAEIKQSMINYGIGLGKTYDPSLDGNGLKQRSFTETWSPWIGQSGGANQLFSGFKYNTFGITVIDLGNGWVEFTIYVSEEEYFG